MKNLIIPSIALNVIFLFISAVNAFFAYIGIKDGVEYSSLSLFLTFSYPVIIIIFVLFSIIFYIQNKYILSFWLTFVPNILPIILLVIYFIFSAYTLII